MAFKKVYPKKRGVRKVRRVRRNAKKQSLVKTINKVLARKVETKISQYSGSITVRSINALTSQAQFDAGCLMVNPQGAIIPAIVQGYPVIANGVGQDQRIGDELKIKGQYIDYLINANDYDATFNPVPSPQIVTLWVVKPKIKNAQGLAVSEVQAGSTSIFFENQFSGDSGFTGNLIDILRKVDTDNFQVIAKRVMKVGWQGNLSTTNVVNSFQSNDYKQFYKGRIKIPSYTWKCDRNDLMQGRCIYMFATTMNGNGLTLATSVLPVSLEFNLTTYYTDM